MEKLVHYLLYILYLLAHSQFGETDGSNAQSNACISVNGASENEV